MPPIEPSLRASLLTGASAIAMSVSASGAYAQTTSPSSTPVVPPTITFWLEGALAYTGGGNYNVPSIPGLGAPFTSLNARSGPEIAFGFDYQYQNQPSHFIFDFRFGQSGTSTVNSSSSSTTTTKGAPIKGAFSSTIIPTTTINNSTAARATEREQHLVADFMAGRDLGIGANALQFQVGLRVADLRASATETSTTTSNITRTFYSLGCFCTETTNSSTASTTFASWNSEFFGIGPRVAVAGSVPIKGAWFFDYGAGIAGLVGDRSFNVNVWNNTGTIFFGNSINTAFVFNSDAMLALSYHFTPHYKFSVGIREDFYANALTTYNLSTGGLSNVNRIYWGPFARLTGSF
jgi:hypothetical protein